MKTIGIIGGSGLYEIEGLKDVKTVEVETPWGSPSDRLIMGKLEDVDLIFLPRHGKGHKIAPSEINYRANIFSMKKLKVDWLLSISAVGSMKREIAPGHIVIPSQFIDKTKNRVSTFFEDGIVAHVSMADPVCPLFSQVVFNASLEVGATVHMGGTYVCIEGPQFSTRAESELYRSWDVDVIGMTNMPEAKLAREAEICYSTLAMSTDYDCWHEDHDSVSVEDVLMILTQNVQLAKDVIKKIVTMLPESPKCECKNALENAIISSKEVITDEIREKFSILLDRYIS